MLSRIIYGARISMFVGLGASALEVLVALLIGGISGLVAGTYDLIVQRVVDAWMCFPPLFILLSVMAILGQGLVTVILVLGISGGIGASRVVRSAVIAIKENTYVSASESVGCTWWTLAIRHILPNIMAPIIIIFTLAVGGMILTEATLSFLGLGVPPPQPSWGSMLSGPSRANLISAPWMAIWPGLALAVVVYGVNMLGDALRDLLDPRLRGGLGSYSSTKKVERARKRMQRQES
jgi:peptide/nickel transport system permease protein